MEDSYYENQEPIVLCLADAGNKDNSSRKANGKTFKNRYYLGWLLHLPEVPFRALLLQRSIADAEMNVPSTENPAPQRAIFLVLDSFESDSYFWPCTGELRTQKLKSHPVRTHSLNVLPLKPGVGRYIAIHATLTARDFFFLISILPVQSPAFFPKPLPIFSCVGYG